jgi:hypothetical protein
MFVSPLGNFYQQRAGARRMPRDISKFWLIPAAVHCILCVELWMCLFAQISKQIFPALRPQTNKCATVQKLRVTFTGKNLKAM